MSDSESEPRLQQEESLHEVSPTPTQQDNSKKSLQIGSSCFSSLASSASDDITDQTKADITILCDLCKSVISVSELVTHTMYHNALQLFKLKVQKSFLCIYFLIIKHFM